MVSFLPEIFPDPLFLPERTAAVGEQRGRIALLIGCVQQVIAPHINLATINVLSDNGIEVVVPSEQVCCGALAQHMGYIELARQNARRNFQAFPENVDAYLTNTAGCGSGIKEYPLLFKGMVEEDQSYRFANKFQDVSVFLNEIGIQTPLKLPQPLKAVYHDACHLYHAQGIVDPPRNLLRNVENLEIIEIDDYDTCCGSAGIYNLDHPQIASKLGSRKIQKILDTGAEAVVTGNIGCMVQMQNHLNKIGQNMPVYHVFELLDMGTIGK
jgi:glycolate oxidase iron-sulfur subunit